MSESSSPLSSQYEVQVTDHVLELETEAIPYQAIAGWQPIFEEDKPVARIFHVAYLAMDPSTRPITFVFNGGPGAASVFLHMGALGPIRVMFDTDGRLPAPPAQLRPNQESWLPFSDLVFVDPIGTGFSRATDPDGEAKDLYPKQKKSDQKDPKPPKEKPFWTVEKDLKILGEFIQHFLSRHHRWLSPVYIAGESYGGFRVANLARMVQQDFGVGLSGVILISPALEFSLLMGDDYTLSYWMTLMPAFAATAAYHNRVQWAGDPGDTVAHVRAAEQFATSTYVQLLAKGDGMAESERQSAYTELAGLIGLPVELVARQRGLINRDVFVRELLRDQRLVVGLYDGALTTVDPFPDRLTYEGADPTLHGSEPVFAAAINHHLRSTLQVETDLQYRLLDFSIFNEWVYDLGQDRRQGYIGSVDNLRAGLSLNPHMKVHVVHGMYDLITTYFATDHLITLMALDPTLKAQVEVSRLDGGHMFYTWESSRIQWFSQIQRFYGAEA